MDCFHQTNKPKEKKKLYTVLQNQEETTLEKQMTVKKTKVSYISL